MISRASIATILMALAAAAAPLTFAPEIGRITVTPLNGEIFGETQHIMGPDHQGAEIEPADPHAGAASVQDRWMTGSGRSGRHANVARGRERGTTPLPVCPATRTTNRGSRSLCRTAGGSTH